VESLLSGERLCKAQGYSYWYRAETRIEGSLYRGILLVLFRCGKHFKINANGPSQMY